MVSCLFIWHIENAQNSFCRLYYNLYKWCGLLDSLYNVPLWVNCSSFYNYFETSFDCQRVLKGCQGNIKLIAPQLIPKACNCCFSFRCIWGPWLMDGSPLPHSSWFRSNLYILSQKHFHMNDWECPNRATTYVSIQNIFQVVHASSHIKINNSFMLSSPICHHPSINTYNLYLRILDLLFFILPPIFSYIYISVTNMVSLLLFVLLHSQGCMHFVDNDSPFQCESS